MLSRIIGTLIRLKRHGLIGLEDDEIRFREWKLAAERGGVRLISLNEVDCMDGFVRHTVLTLVLTPAQAWILGTQLRAEGVRPLGWVEGPHG